MDNFAKYTPKFFHSKEHDITSGIPPRLDNLEYPFCRILQFSFQDAYRRQNQLPPRDILPFRLLGFTDVSSMVSDLTHGYLNNVHGFAFYESLSRIFGTGFQSGNSGFMLRKMPQGSLGILAHGMKEGERTDIYGAIDWRGNFSSHYNADIFGGIRRGPIRLEGFTRLREKSTPFMDLTTVKGVCTVSPFFKQLQARFDLGGELSMMEGAVSNAYGAIRMSHIPSSTTIVLGLTVLGYMNMIYGYKPTDYLTFAAMFDIHLITYAAETTLAAEFKPGLLPRHNIFNRNALLRHLHTITGRINPDHGIAFKFEFKRDRTEEVTETLNKDEIYGSYSHHQREKERQKRTIQRALRYLPQPADVYASLIVEVPPSIQDFRKNLVLGFDLSVEW